MSNAKKSTANWLNAFLPLGCADGSSWLPIGGAVLLLDTPMVWLVTARSVVETTGDRSISTWIRRTDDHLLLNLTDSQKQSGLDWIHHDAGVSATLFPVDPSFALKAFAETQCARVRDLQPLLPAATLGGMYGNDIAPTPYPVTAVCDGIISAVDQQSGLIHTTAPLMPRNVGGPLLLASPYGDTVSLAGILVGKANFVDNDPREVPVKLSQAICVDAALELIRGEAAQECRRRVSTDDSNTPPHQGEEGSKS